MHGTAGITWETITTRFVFWRLVHTLQSLTFAPVGTSLSSRSHRIQRMATLRLPSIGFKVIGPQGQWNVFLCNGHRLIENHSTSSVSDWGWPLPLEGGGSKKDGRVISGTDSRLGSSYTKRLSSLTIFVGYNRTDNSWYAAACDTCAPE